MLDFSADSPCVLIWTSPRKAIQKIIETHPNYLNFPLAFLISLDRLLFEASQQSLGLHYNYSVILGLAILIGIGYAFVWLYFFGWILQQIGKCFGGSAPFAHVRTVLAWAGAPALLSIAVWFALLLFFPKSTFIKMDSGPSLLFLYFIMLIPSVWSLAIGIIGLQEVQHFSVGKAVGNWIIFFAIFLLFQKIGFFLWAYFLTFM
ncbi:MAG: YIP1 family protein [Chlamydiota bacterium]